MRRSSSSDPRLLERVRRVLGYEVEGAAQPAPLALVHQQVERVERVVRKGRPKLAVPQRREPLAERRVRSVDVVAGDDPERSLPPLQARRDPAQFPPELLGVVVDQRAVDQARTDGECSFGRESAVLVAVRQDRLLVAGQEVEGVAEEIVAVQRPVGG